MLFQFSILIIRGYMAPEYALWGYLTDKADVYSFGVLTLEVVSGKNNNSFMPSDNSVCLLDWVLPMFDLLHSYCHFQLALHVIIYAARKGFLYIFDTF